MNQSKKLYRYAVMATCAAFMSASLLSCSDGDDDPDISGNITDTPSAWNVFTEGLPTNIGGATLESNEKGQVTRIQDGTKDITFEYGRFTPSRAGNFTVVMKNRDKMYPSEDNDIYMQINKQEFVEYAYMVYLDAVEEPEEWWFEYNGNGQLKRVKQNDSDKEFNITYKNGDITKVVQVDEDGDRFAYTINYTNDKFSTPVANKGCVMLYDDCFQIDMDEMEIAYYAGLLGKATVNLPMGYVDVEDEMEETFYWEFNSMNLPVKFSYGSYGAENFTWTW